MPEIVANFYEQNGHIAYPFDAEDIYLTTDPNDPQAQLELSAKSAFVDAQLSFSYNNTNIPTGSYWQIDYYDSISGEIGLVCNTSPTYTATININPPKIIHIGSFNALVACGYDSDKYVYVCLVLNYDDGMYPEDKVYIRKGDNVRVDLVARCINVIPTGITSIQYSSTEIAGYGETCYLQERYNICMAVNPDLTTPEKFESADEVMPDKIVITAEPGCGIGRKPTECDDTGGIRTINNVKPNAGNISLVGSECYNITRPAGAEDGDEFNADNHELQINNDCVACCDCADFADILEQIRELKDQGLEIKGIWEQVRALYEEILAQWESTIECLGDKCFVKVIGYAYSGWAVTVQIYVANVQTCAKGGVSATVTLSGGDYEWMYIPGSGTVYNANGIYTQSNPSGTNPFTIADSSVTEGSGYKILTFSVRAQNTDDRIDGNIVSIKADVTACDSAVETVYSSVALISNTAKE